MAETGGAYVDELLGRPDVGAILNDSPFSK
jgi:hypothetical protein